MTTIKRINFRFVGTCDLLINNPQCADPLNDYAMAKKEINDKGKKKTIADHHALAALDFESKIHLNANDQLVITSEMVKACIVAGAKLKKKGPAAKAGIRCYEDFVITKMVGPVEWQKRKKLTKSKDRCQFRTIVVINKNRVAITRPLFHNWEAEGYIEYDESIVNRVDIHGWLDNAGYQIGIGDYRPEFGRFEIKWLDKEDGGPGVRKTKVATKKKGANK